MGAWDDVFKAGKGLASGALDSAFKDFAQEVSQKLTGGGTAKRLANYEKLSLNIEEARAALKELDALASDILMANKTAAKCRDSLKAGWQGSSGAEMQANMQAWINEQADISYKMEATAKQYNRLVQSLVDKDAKLAQMIRNS